MDSLISLAQTFDLTHGLKVKLARQRPNPAATPGAPNPPGTMLVGKGADGQARQLVVSGEDVALAYHLAAMYPAKGARQRRPALPQAIPMGRAAGQAALAYLGLRRYNGQVVPVRSFPKALRWERQYELLPVALKGLFTVPEFLACSKQLDGEKGRACRRGEVVNEFAYWFAEFHRRLTAQVDADVQKTLKKWAPAGSALAIVDPGVAAAHHDGVHHW